ncbi:MAG: YbaB/EbfC family nucleoid-associated protein [Candidatus Beckwithbacteria bacterium]|nr:YbaB/EbfC family nucleoid-associated protein [Patescibacteria group bacterium]
MFDKVKQLGQLKKMRDQAMTIQKQLAQEEIEISEDGIKIVITGDQKLKSLEIDGMTNIRVLELINKAIKKSQEMAAKKLAEMSGGLTGMLKGQGPMGGN